MASSASPQNDVVSTVPQPVLDTPDISNSVSSILQPNGNPVTQSADIYQKQWSHCAPAIAINPSHSCPLCQKTGGMQILMSAKFLGTVSSDNAAVSFENFPQYSLLPGELRAKIIAAAMNVPRLLCSHIQVAQRQHPGSELAQPHTLGGLYSVNQETRAEVLKHIRLSEPTLNGCISYPWSYINPSWDVVFCQQQPYDRGNWGEIPNSAEAPGLRTLALELSPRDVQEPPLSWCYRDLAIQLRALPDLEEVLLVRQLPRFMQHFVFRTTPCGKYPIHNTYPVPKLTKHSSGFFYNQDREIESWLAKSMYAGRMRGLLRGKLLLREGEKLDETDEFVQSLIWEDDAWLMETLGQRRLQRLCDGGEKLPNFVHEFKSSSMEYAFRIMTSNVAKQRNWDWKPPKFRVVYHQPEIVREICDHS